MAIDSNVLQEVVDALKQDPEIKNNVYQATVSRIDGEGVVWVNIAGSDTETPTAITSAEVAPGDAVNVEWRNNKLYIGGNYSNPSAGVVRVANVEQIADVAVANASRAQTAAANAEISAQSAQESASAASTAAGNALTAAGTAQTAADSALVGLSTVEDVVGVLNWITAHGTMTSQSGGTFDPDQVYFVMDDSTPGDYHVGSHYYSIVSEPKAADINSYYVLTVDESVQNYVATHLAVDSEGLWIIPDAGGNKVLIATGAGSTYTTAGTYIVGKVGGVDTVLAKFTASGVQIGQTGDSHLDLDYHSLQLVDKEGTDYFHISDLRGSNGTGQVIAKYIGNGADSSFILPAEATNTNYTVTVSDSSGGTVSKYTTSVSFQTPPTKGAIITVTYNSSSDRLKSYTLGMRDPDYTTGIMSYAEGVANISDSFCSHAEGFQSSSRNWASHAEGEGTAEGQYSHAEGWGHAIGKYSHAEGEGTYANGEASHAQNMWTTADGDYQTALGRYNIRDYSDTYSVIIGNGSYNNPSNALTVDWLGNVEAAGDVTDGAGNVLSDKQDKYSGYGSEVDLSSYTSSTNYYTAPSDGIIRLRANVGTGKFIQCKVANNDGTNESLFSVSGGASASGIIPAPIFKGQRTWISARSAAADTSFVFIPFTT